MSSISSGKLLAFAINLDRSTDRLKTIEKEFSRNNLDWQRVSAVDGKYLSEQDWAKVDKKGYDFCHGRILNPNEIGCYLSHIKALEQFLTTDAEFGLIVEDDVIFEPEFKTLLPEVLSNKHSWDVLSLNGFHSGAPVGQKTFSTGHRLVAYLTSQTNTLAYFVNRKTAENMIKALTPMRTPYDHAFNKGWLYDGKFRGIKPYITKEVYMPSTIDHQDKAAREKQKKAWYRRISVLLYRMQNETRRQLYNIRHGHFIPKS